MCSSKTFLDSTVSSNDENILVNGCSFLRADHPSNFKLGGVCIHFKQSLQLMNRNDLTNMKECFVTEINVNNEKKFFICLYSSPSQNHDKLEQFCTNFDLLFSNINDLHPTCSIALGDFNEKCSKWCASDKSNTACIELDNITITSDYSQMIDKATHYINGSSSCIDLIFSSNVNFKSLYETCHYNIFHGTLNFNIPHLPPYFREICKIAYSECIQK